MHVRRGTAGPDLGAVWPVVAARLRASLRSVGVPAADVDDVIQEVALRVVANDVAFASSDDLLRWCRLVGRRLAVDEHRRRRRLDVVAEVPDAVASVDLEQAVLSRVRAEQVLRAVTRLAPADRVALLPVATVDDRRAQVRLAVRRHRARARLAAIVDGVAAVAGWALVRRRRPAPILAAMAVSPAVTGLLLLPSFEQPLEPTARPAAPAVVEAEPGPAPAGDAAPALAAPAPPVAVAVAVAAPTPAAGDRPERQRRRPIRRAVDALRDAEPTVVVHLTPPVPVPSPLPAVRMNVAGLEVALDL